VRVLQVVPTYFPATRYGGPIESVHGLAKALVARGHTVDVMTTNVDGAGVSPVPVGSPVDLDGVSVRYFHSPFPRLYWSPELKKALQRDISSYDVVHGHSVFLWPTAAACKLATRAGVPYIISPRGMLVPELIRHRSAFAKRTWIGLVERRNFARASAIHFTSVGELEQARATGIPLPSPFIVPNGTTLLEEREESRDARMVLYLGRINWKKGIDKLIVAMKDVPDADLVIAGNDEENYIPTLPKAERVVFAGAVSGTIKLDLLARATMLVLPSRNENFGNAVLEAMAAGTPVVVTAGVGLAPDIVRAEAGVVVENNDPGTLAGAIRSLLDDPFKRTRMGVNARRLVAERFTWSHVAGQMEVAYEQLRR
jgi:glycosyltransferase involved in cell wall biosynthesis